MYANGYMSGKSVHLIMENIFHILKKEKEMSIRQLSMETGSQWITVEKALNSMKLLGLVKEQPGKENKRKTRLFRLVNC